MTELKRRQIMQLFALKGLVGVAGAGVASGCEKRSRSQTEAPPSRSPEKRQADTAIHTVTDLPVGAPWPTPDPFLFCVHHDDHYPASNGRFGPQASLEGRDIGQDFARKDGWSMYHGRSVPGFPAHPHRGFETVTVVRKGLLDHADSMGAAARYGEGDVQWLTAGAGIQHAEMFPLLHSERSNPLELFQIWLNLARERKLVAPHFSMLWADSIPLVIARDGAGIATEVSLRAGRLGDVQAPPPAPNSWASASDNEVAIWTIRMGPSGKWRLPPAAKGLSRSLYFFRGQGLSANGQSLGVGKMLTLNSHVELELVNGPEEAELLLLQGRPIAEPVARRGPFVMNTQTEIRQAYEDFRETRFGGWPWTSSDPVHGDQAERFAKREDGRIERPG